MEDNSNDFNNSNKNEGDENSSEAAVLSENMGDNQFITNNYMEKEDIDQFNEGGIEENGDVTGGMDNEQEIDGIQDCNGDFHSKQDVLRAILMFKKNSRNFFWGHLMNNCNKMNRKIDDRWYPWSNEMMMVCDQNEMKMKKILLNHSHAKIQEICKNVGGELWENKTTKKIEKLVIGLKKIERTMKLERGMKTCWGRLKYESVFKNSLRTKNEQGKGKFKSKKIYDVVDYIKYLDNKWKKHYENFKEKEEVSKFYHKY